MRWLPLTLPKPSSRRPPLANAQQRAQSLLEDYVTNVGNLVGKEYTIRWIYLDENGDKSGETVTSQLESDEASEVEADSSGE